MDSLPTGVRMSVRYTYLLINASVLILLIDNI